MSKLLTEPHNNKQDLRAMNVPCSRSHAHVMQDPRICIQSVNKEKVTAVLGYPVVEKSFETNYSALSTKPQRKTLTQ